MNFGVSSMVLPLKKVALLRPGTSLLEADTNKWHYNNIFNPDKVQSIYNNFAKLLTNEGVEIYWIKEETNIADAIFTYDASMMTKSGAILMSPGKELRKGEQNIHRNFYKHNNIPIIGEITGNATAEAGDTLWLDDNTLIVGKSFRTNQEGVNQIKELMKPVKVDVFQFDIPVYMGMEACLHLMSLISLVDHRKALVYTPLLPVSLFKLLKEKGFTLINAPEDEFLSSNTLNTNILTISPGKCIMIDGFPKTRESLENFGISVKVFNADELCIACEGGPTCLTRPLLRS
jgi:N-dimethylarginine dimethylaminohydrolase